MGLIRKGNTSFVDWLAHWIYYVMIAFALLFIFFSVPVAIGGAFSKNAIATFPPTGLSLVWIMDFINNARLVKGLMVSLSLAGIVVPLTVLIAISASFVIVRYRFKGKEQLNTFFLSPLIVPPVAIGVALSFFLRSTLQFRETFESLVILHMVLTLPYGLRTISAALGGFDVTLEEAARTLGASALESFVRITLPSIKAGIIAAAIFAFAASMDDVGATIFLARSDASPLPVELFNYLRVSITPTIAAASIILIAATVVITFILDKYIGLEEFMGIRIY